MHGVEVPQTDITQVKGALARGGRKSIRAKRTENTKKKGLPDTTRLVPIRTHRDHGRMHKACIGLCQMGSQC